MKFIKFSLFIISFLFINSVHAQRSQSFEEFNAGIFVNTVNRPRLRDVNGIISSSLCWSCSVQQNRKNRIFVFPGASYLWGKTYLNNKRIFEWQSGVALPTFITGKLTLAHGKFDKYSGISLRVWPLTIGPQLKINRLTFSAEYIPTLGWSIFTVGFRR